jgi:hypothetical protein
VAEHLCGLHRALVFDNLDPEGRHRIRVTMRGLLGDAATDWVWPCMPVGTTSVPAIGQGVWIMFEQGDQDKPVWLGVFSTT